MILIEVEENPNCPSSTMVFRESGPRRRVRQVKAGDPRPGLCDVTGLDTGGRPGSAYACPVEDSGDGTAWLVYGGSWGLRFRPAGSLRDWDLNDDTQWGEAYQVYGDPSDLIFEDGREA